TKRLPELVPGFRVSDAERAQVLKISDHLFRSRNVSAFLIEDEAQLGAKLSSLVTPDVALSPSVPDIGFVHRKLANGETYFLANTGNTRHTTIATFRVTQLQPEWWDPMSGNVSAAAVKHRTATTISVDLDLEPYASRILVFSARTLQPDLHRTVPGKIIDLSRGWRVTFGNKQTVVMDELRSWTASDDTRYFSGRATYEKTVFVSQTSLGAGSSALLDFGEGKPIPSHELKAGMQAWLDAPVREAAVVYVNGERAGSLWCPPYSVDVTKLLHPGANNLKVEVANLAVNHMAGRSLPDYRLLNLRYGTRFEAQDMDKVQSIPAGLFGPIRLATFGTAVHNGNSKVPRRADLR
ncbi:MAG TPA: glycosyl hydrolase, partial [Terriglobales bacterium]|nr:glycosyl hydrolase [Terriglobales bacterium]